MTTHAIVKMKISTPEKLAAYREKAADALAKHGGSVLQASRELSVIEGSAELPDIVAILAFPDQAAAQCWINDPSLQEVHALRQGCGETSIILL